MVGEDFLSALHTFNARRGRTVLSLLGIVVGITSVVVVATLGSSLGASVEKLFEEDNNNIISVAPVAAHDDGVTRGQLVLTEHVRHHLKERVAGVQGFFYLNYLQASASRRSLHAG
ncbi:ABC transporter permease, partial [Treponema paraluiscuniculi]